MASVKYFPLSSRSPSTGVKQPKEIASFSRNIKQEYENNDSCLSYYYFPDQEVEKPANVDLSHGFQKFKKMDETKDGDLDGLLKAIIAYEKKYNAVIPKIDIITFRGLMRKILTIPYGNESFDFNLLCFDNQLFIKSDKESDMKRNELEQKRMQKRINKSHGKKISNLSEKFVYSGYKFETLTTLNKPWSKCSRDEIEKRYKKEVNNIEQYAVVVKTGIGKNKMLLCGEVDCVFDYKPQASDFDEDNPLTHYVELKTSKTINDISAYNTFRKKLFKAWAQCFLIGIPKIIYGFRDDQLKLKAVEMFKTEDVPVLIKADPQERGNQISCIDAIKWYGAAIEWIWANIDVKNEKTVWRLSYNFENKTFSLRELPEEKSSEIINNYEILTKEFVDWRLQLRSNQN
ncbi:DXO/RAI1 family decapping nuclease [Ascoidea rubescens DSM 1968]|uniref:Decapping nuclease n=1 Tax=Ascoidea rubescens DSM 1968 TaxID=1344418 RepID=A0A1D2VA05_9ASCO|nr:RAI1-domain-containing protein [Ascoidea rubescens DSM 1968]ODV58385.1 RAI1-domain-containing protein [Ascoidea rubescens DSM 1968]